MHQQHNKHIYSSHLKHQSDPIYLSLTITQLLQQPSTNRPPRRIVRTRIMSHNGIRSIPISSPSSTIPWPRRIVTTSIIDTIHHTTTISSRIITPTVRIPPNRMKQHRRSIHTPHLILITLGQCHHVRNHGWQRLSLLIVFGRQWGQRVRRGGFPVERILP